MTPKKIKVRPKLNARMVRKKREARKAPKKMNVCKTHKVKKALRYVNKGRNVRSKGTKAREHVKYVGTSGMYDTKACK